MPLRHYPGGFGQSHGTALATRRNLYTTLPTLYVSSAIGNDANVGLDPRFPKASVFGTSGAYPEMATRSYLSAFIVCLPEHDETPPDVSSITRNLVIVGAGVNRPKIRCGDNAGLVDFLGSSSTTYLEVHGIEFPEASGFTPPDKIDLGAAATAFGVYLRDCYVSLGTSDDLFISSQATGPFIWCRDTTFVATNTASSSEQLHAVSVGGAGTPGVRLQNCTFDGGAYGWSEVGAGYEAVAVVVAATTGQFVWSEDTTLLRSSNMLIGFPSAVVHVAQATGGSQVQFSAPGGDFYPSNAYVDGIASGEGPTLGTDGTLYCDADAPVIYVSSTTGTNDTSVSGGATYHGISRDKPYATLAAAWAVRQVGTIFVLMSGHTETISANLAMDAVGIVILGEGESDTGEPEATLTFSGTPATPMITISGYGCQIRNVKFPTAAATTTQNRIAINAALVVIGECLFECSGTDTANVVQIGANYVATHIRDTIFRSTAGSSSSKPYPGLGNVSSGGHRYTRLDNVTFDGGTYGWRTVACTLQGAQMRGESLTLQNGADILLNGTGYMFVGSANNGGLVSWQSETEVGA